MPTNPPVAATPMAFVRCMVQAYVRYGKDPAAALAWAQITPQQLTEPEGRITAQQMERISGYAMRELDDEALGWFSRRLPWGSYGMLARASISAPTLGLAIQRWCRHHGLLTGDIALDLQVNGTGHAATACLRITEQCELGGMREFCLVSVLRNIWGLASWLVDSRITVLQARFPFEAPPHSEAYSVLFPAPTFFQQGDAAIIFDAQYLQLPLRRDEAALQTMLKNALPLTVLQYRRDRLLVQQVCQLLARQPAGGQSAEVLAELLHLSPRTLHRQLKEEGATLQVLKDEVRRDRACDLLLRSRKPVKQVAEAAGFQNEKSFIRAFKGWTGQTPADYRRHPPHLPPAGA